MEKKKRKELESTCNGKWTADEGKTQEKEGEEEQLSATAKQYTIKGFHGV